MADKSFYKDRAGVQHRPDLKLYIGDAILRWSQLTHILVHCCYMLQNNTSAYSENSLGLFCSERSKKPLISLRSEQQIKIFGEICDKHPHIISKESLCELIQSLEDGREARNFFSHNALLENKDKFHYYERDREDPSKAKVVWINRICIQKKLDVIRKSCRLLGKFYSRIKLRLPSAAPLPVLGRHLKRK